MVAWSVGWPYMAVETAEALHEGRKYGQSTRYTTKDCSLYSPLLGSHSQLLDSSLRANNTLLQQKLPQLALGPRINSLVRVDLVVGLSGTDSLSTLSSDQVKVVSDGGEDVVGRGRDVDLVGFQPGFGLFDGPG